MTPAETRPASRSSWKVLSMLAAVALAAVLLYFSLRGIDWAGAWALAKNADARYLAIAIALSTVSLFLRAVRWRVLLTAGARVGVGTAFWATSAGYFGNNFLPARAGELVRTFMISSGTRLSAAFVLTTALFERMADAIVLVTISAAVLLAIPDPPGWLGRMALPFAIAGLCAVVVVAIAPRLERFGQALIARVLPAKLRNAASHALKHVIDGIRAIHDGRRLLIFLVFTAMIWLGDATTTVVGARALHLTMSYPVAFLLIAGLGLGSALPSTPGYVGVYQFVAVSVLLPFGYSRTEAIAYILLYQVITYVVIGFWGSIGFAGYRRSMRGGPPDPA